MHHQKCQCDHLASSPVGHVTMCANCGQVHLTLQYMTVRLELGVFKMVATMIGDAQQRMDILVKEPSVAARASAAGNLH
jgi:hypothetical protein